MEAKSLTGLRILIVDDSALVRGAIRKLLQDDQQLDVYEWGEVAGAVQHAKDVDADVILLDMSMPGVSGIALASEFHEAFPGAQVVLMSEQDPTVLRALTKLAGLQWCISKSELVGDLVPLLEKIATG
jgi:two-component system nitrate/nitrite response regulator NarL